MGLLTEEVDEARIAMTGTDQGRTGADAADTAGGADARAGVLAGADGSDRGMEAVEWAARESAARGLPLRICHVLPTGTWGGPPAASERRAFAQRVLATAAERARAAAPDVEVDETVLEGQPADELVTASGDAAALVLGARGAGGFSALLLGSVSEQVATDARCPVVVVRGEPRDGRILVGVDGSPQSAAALGFAFERAERLGLEVHPVHAFELAVAVPSFGFVPELGIEDLHDAATQTLREAVAPWMARYPNVPVVEHLVPGRAANALVEESASSGLLVVGARGHGGFTGLLLGSVSRQVLRHAECPVVVLHA